jgi:hypothetical protein
MSMKGARALELERERREALRLEQVRGECRALVAGCQASVDGVRDAVVQQYAAAELSRWVGELRDANGRIQDSPDATLVHLQELQQRIATTLTMAEARALSWTEEQAQARARARALAGRIEAVVASQKESAGLGTREASRWVEEARGHASRGAGADARQCLDRAEQALTTARAAGFEERVRKELVKGLLKTLKDMGFIVVGPQLSEDLVTLEGNLPSGRRARFEVRIDGQMTFDLDGYEGRACAQDMEKVETAMRDRFGVKMGPPQVVWKNPDRLSQGALPLPGGQRRNGQ